MTFSHLTDKQFSGYLAGQSSEASDDHLVACAACRAEIDRMRASLRAFNQASLEWAEHLPCVHRPAPTWRPAGVVASLLTVILLVGLLHRPQQVRIAASAGGDNTAELKQDNELLSAIDKELDSTQLSPTKMYGITESMKAQ
jgi:hypothetical protein